MGASFWEKRLNKKLSKALYYGHAYDARRLIEKGAAVNMAEGHWGSPLYYAARSSNLTEVIRLLLSKGADPNPADTTRSSPLLEALEQKNIEAAKLLIDAGADVTRRNDTGMTALIFAAEQGAGDLVTALVAKGADVAAKTDRGDTAMHLAAQKGYGNIVRYLIDNGAACDAANASMNTAADVAEKDFPRIADMIRGTAPTAAPLPPGQPAPATVPAPAAAAPTDADWCLIADDEVAHIAEREAIGYRLTELFNFSTGIYTRLARSLETGAESQAVRFFAEFADRTALEQAHEALVRLGGSADAKTFGKPSIPAPGLTPPGGTR